MPALEFIRSRTAELIGKDVENLDLDTSLVNLEADSLDLTELLISIEEEFDVSVETAVKVDGHDFEFFDMFHTLNEFAKAVDTLLEAKEELTV